MKGRWVLILGLVSGDEGKKSRLLWLSGVQAGVLTPEAPVGQGEPLSRVRHSKAAVLSASLPQGSHACSYGLSPRG